MRQFLRNFAGRSERQQQCIAWMSQPIWASTRSSTSGGSSSSSSSSAPSAPTDGTTAAASPSRPPVAGSAGPSSLIVGKLKNKPLSTTGKSGDASSISGRTSRSSVNDSDPPKDKATTSTSGPVPQWKVKRAPWGALQLRDSWSEDAMTKRDKDNMNERMHREYRFHPHEQQRRVLKWGGLAVVPMFCLGMALAYSYHMGQAFWKGDPQFILNVLRSADCSPRSKFYPYRLEGVDVYPEHIERYRKAQREKLDEAARLAADATASKNAEMQAAIQRVRVA